MTKKENIPEATEVKAYYYGRTIEMTDATGPKHRYYKVIKGHRYINLLTGEIFDMDRSAKSRIDNISSVKRTMKKLRRLIGANFGSNGVNRKNQLWITLTYREDINALTPGSSQIVYHDFKSLMRKLRRRFGKLEYIAVLEPQASGRWHLHVLLKAPQKISLYIKNNDLEFLWGKGFTSTKRLNNSDNVAGYVMAYVSDLDLNLTHTDKSTDKKIIKGGRLYLYPKGVRIYRRSKGIKPPHSVNGKKYELLPEYQRQQMFEPKVYKGKIRTKNGGFITTTTEFYVRKMDSDGKTS